MSKEALISLLDDGFNQTERESGNDFAELAKALVYVLRELTACLDDDDRPDTVVPIVVELDANATPTPDGTKGRVTGKTGVGLGVCLQDRAVLAWQTGTLKLKTGVIVLPYSAIRDVRLVDFHTRGQDVIGIELLADHRYPIMFTPELNLGAARLRLKGRLEGSMQPVWHDTDDEQVRGKPTEASPGLTAGRRAPSGGTPISPAEPDDGEQQFCGQCGGVWQRGAKFCGACGARQEFDSDC